MTTAFTITHNTNNNCSKSNITYSAMMIMNISHPESAKIQMIFDYLNVNILFTIDYVATTRSNVFNIGTTPPKSALQTLQLAPNPITIPACNPPILPMIPPVLISPNRDALTTDNQLSNDNSI